MEKLERAVNGACVVGIVVFGLALLGGWIGWWPA